jgi:hypothetical protein
VRVQRFLASLLGSHMSYFEGALMSWVGFIGVLFKKVM